MKCIAAQLNSVVRVSDHPDLTATFAGVVATDRSVALFTYAQLTTGLTEVPVPVRFAGLEPEKRYEVELLALANGPELAERKAAGWIADSGITLSGQVLHTIGLQMPILKPEQALLLELRAV